MEPEACADLAGFLAGLLDLGKFTRNFQAKVEALGPAPLGAWPGANALGPPHWRATALLLQLDLLKGGFRNLIPNLGGGAISLLAAIVCHHGRPPPIDVDTDNAAVAALR